MTRPSSLWMSAAATAAVGFGVVGVAVAHAGPKPVSPSPAEKPQPAWCAPELQVLARGICYSPAPPLDTGDPTLPQGAAHTADPPAAEAHPARATPSRPRTLIIFLHSLVAARSTWQWQQQRMMANSGKKNGFAVLMPRGRLGIGPGRVPNVWAWPGSPAMQEKHEAEVLEEWMTHKETLEQTEGPFDKVFVFGFSNGAYYATSLAVRGRLQVDGYGVFAGGSGSKYNRILARQAPWRAPVFVGYGTKDPDHHRQQALIRLLSGLHWRHHSLAARVGHLVTDTQLASALRFLSSG